MKKIGLVGGTGPGRTELPLLLNKNNCPVDCLDSVEIHLQKLIELARD